VERDRRQRGRKASLRRDDDDGENRCRNDRGGAAGLTVRTDGLTADPLQKLLGDSTKVFEPSGALTKPLPLLR
jgi:hypothetical protein